MTSQFRTVQELQEQIKQHEDRIFEISQQVRALAWETKQRTEAIKSLKREIKLAKRKAREERWRERLSAQQDVKDITAKAKGIKYADAVTPGEPWPRC